MSPQVGPTSIVLGGQTFQQRIAARVAEGTMTSDAWAPPGRKGMSAARREQLDRLEGRR